jgi:hypothetical protein
MATYPTVAESAAGPLRVGWSAGVVRVLSAAGLDWLVTGQSEKEVLQARGASHAATWYNAVQQVAAVGLPSQGPRTADLGD